MKYFLPPPYFAPPYPFPGLPDIAYARWEQLWGHPSVDQVWLLRDHYQDAANETREKSWSTRFKILGAKISPQSPKEQG